MPADAIEPTRCAWAASDPLLRRYHDEEWSVPVHDGRALWEKLMLDGFQAGLSWLTILRKREAFRHAFEGFVPARVARYGERDIQRLLADPGIVRSRAKITATIGNARAYLAMQRAGEDFAPFVWRHVDGRPLHNHWRDAAAVPNQSAFSQRLSTELKRRGFRFVGPVIVYAWLQASGLINDHTTDCHRHAALVAPPAP